MGYWTSWERSLLKDKKNMRSKTNGNEMTETETKIKTLKRKIEKLFEKLITA